MILSDEHIAEMRRYAMDTDVLVLADAYEELQAKYNEAVAVIKAIVGDEDESGWMKCPVCGWIKNGTHENGCV